MPWESVILGALGLSFMAGNVLWLGQEAAVKSVALQVWKGGLTYAFLAPHFSVTSHVQGNNNNMLQLYIMHGKQEFTHSILLSVMLSEEQWMILCKKPAVCMCWQLFVSWSRRGAASSFCPALSLVQSYCCPAVHSNSGWVFSDKFAFMWKK